MRYKAVVQYIGTRFHGWQMQKGVDSVTTAQHVLQRACQRMNNNVPVTVVAAGRTDAGVHALGQTVHFDLAPTNGKPPIDALSVQKGINFFLRKTCPLLCDDIAVLDVEQVSDEFHARFSATHREYVYRVLHGVGANLPVFETERNWVLPDRLSLPHMQDAAAEFLGHHNFASFCSVHEPRHKNRSVESIDFEVMEWNSTFTCFSTPPRDNGYELVNIRIRAPSFLQRQVRAMVGCLVEVGTDGHPPSYVKDRLAMQCRVKNKSHVAPARGLYFYRAHY